MEVNVFDLTIRILVMALVFAAVLFLPAGTLVWAAEWTYLVLL